jgi:hypothetical protein
MKAGSASSGRPFRTAIWRDFLRLAAEGLTIGLFVSAVLGLAVMAIASQSPPREREPAQQGTRSASDRGGPWSAAGGELPAGRFRSA